MKLAKEIVLEVGGGGQWFSGTVIADELESIIAAKLEPVAQLLAEVETCVHEGLCNLVAYPAICDPLHEQLKAIFALLSEEE